MSNFVFIKNVQNNKTKEKFELFLDKKTMQFLLRNRDTGEIKNATSKETKEFKRKYFLKYNFISFKRELLDDIKTYLKLMGLLYLLDLFLTNQKIIEDIPRLANDYLFHSPTNEQIVEDTNYFIEKNNSLSSQEKTYIEQILHDYMSKDFQNNDFLTILKAYRQLTTLDLIFLNPEMGETKYYQTLGEFREYPMTNDQVLIYEDSYSTGLHELIHAIYPINCHYKYGISLYEGYAASVEANYSGTMSYSIQNEHLCIISQIIGTNKTLNYLNNGNYIGLTNEIAAKTHVSYFEVKELIDSMDTYLFNCRRGNNDQELLNSINAKLYELSVKALGEEAKDNFYLRNITNQHYRLASPFFLAMKCYEIVDFPDEIVNDERITINPGLIVVYDYDKTKDDFTLIVETCQNERFRTYNDILKDYGNYSASLLSYLIIHDPKLEDLNFEETSDIFVYEENGVYYHFYPAVRGATGEIRYCHKETALGDYEPYIGQIPICNFRLGEVEIPVFMVEISTEDHHARYLNATMTVNYLNYLNDEDNTIEPVLLK